MTSLLPCHRLITIHTPHAHSQPHLPRRVLPGAPKPCVPSQEPVLLARAVIELELQRELDVVCVRPVHVVLKGVIENREDALRRAHEFGEFAKPGTRL